ncbi:MAG: hypothetical protein E6851_10210 [Actinomyces urogenitalis]|uniref:hypothetical protein n=1 Tax=Actinomyces urogenitalis TaxID=103621 RepID=UPI0029028257|nr:hypothetical protein [Actinomyces urogenitalis]MDU1565569.1 hypothetical protein [Actinomyces urogenitalis]MDU1640720.1 hypothetical protein [Actinomyces urogenitalis]
MSQLSVPQAATTRAARHLMIERGWKHSDLADALCLSTSTLRAKIYGRRKWTRRDIEDLRNLGAEVPAFGEVSA